MLNAKEIMARVVIGVHGATLTMIMFVRPGTVVIELFPFAVPSENYTPYRTLSNLPGMDLTYRAWENTHEENTVGHPEAGLWQGGLKHLSPQERDRVMKNNRVQEHLCCSDPNCLYRLFQDTRVKFKELLTLVSEAIRVPPRVEQFEAVATASGTIV